MGKIFGANVKFRTIQGQHMQIGQNLCGTKKITIAAFGNE